jgi:hypothetical protein
MGRAGTPFWGRRTTEEETMTRAVTLVPGSHRFVVLLGRAIEHCYGVCRVVPFVAPSPKL